MGCARAGRAAAGAKRRTRNSISSCCSIGSGWRATKSQPWRWSGGAASPPARGAGHRQRDGGAGFLAQMGDPAAGRTAGERHPARRIRRSRSRSTGDRADAARGAGNARQDRGAGHARPPARAARVGLLARWGIEADDSAGQAAVGRRRRGRCCSASPAPPRRSWRRWRCWRLLKHPLVGGEGDERVAWLDARSRARSQAPRPAAGGGACRARRRFRCEGCASGSSLRAARRTRSTGMLREPSRWPVCADLWRRRPRRLPATRRGAGRRAGWQPSAWPSSQASPAAQR